MNTPVQTHPAFTLYQFPNGLFCAVSPDGKTYRDESDHAAKLACMEPAKWRIVRPVGEPDSEYPFVAA